MYSVSDEFLNALKNEPYQKIRGSIECIDGTLITIDGTKVTDDIRTESQCVEDEEVFNFGEIFTGSVEFTLIVEQVGVNQLWGAEVTLDFGLVVDEENDKTEWIPLGVWDVVSAERVSGNMIKIKGYDRTNRLNTALTDRSIGWVSVESAMAQVSKDAGVEFEQSIEDLKELFPETDFDNMYGVQLSETCRDEVKAIAQYLGCFAFANREGKIEFRKYGQGSANGGFPEITQNQRFSLKLGEYLYRIRAFSYTDKFGNITRSLTNQTDSNGAELNFSDNRYMEVLVSNDSYKTESNIREILENIENRVETSIAYIAAYNHWERRSGEAEFYGNPALDVGDAVVLTGGTAGEKPVFFLIGSSSWQFRGRHRIVCGGVPESEIAQSFSSGVSSSTVNYQTTVNQSEKIKKVDLECFCGDFFGEEYLSAKGAFSCRDGTTVFISCTMIFLGTEENIVSVNISLDEEILTLNPKAALHEDEYSTVSFQISETVSGGTHQVKIAFSGNGNLENMTAFVWGQNVTEESPQRTEDDEYTYTVSNGKTTVTGYHGTKLYPQIPSVLGGGVTTILAETSFTNSQIEGVYIPNDVTEIR